MLACQSLLLEGLPYEVVESALNALGGLFKVVYVKLLFEENLALLDTHFKLVKNHGKLVICGDLALEFFNL